jgi:Helix-turn-helix domain
VTEWSYPGDEAICRGFFATVTRIVKEKNLTLQELEKRLAEAWTECDWRSHEQALGRAVKRLREKRHITRKALAASAGIPVRLLIRVERGHGGKTSLPEVCRIAHALKLRPHELMEHYEKAFKEASSSHSGDNHNW